MSDFHNFHEKMQAPETSEYVDALKQLQELEAEEIEHLASPDVAGGHWGW